MKTTIEIRVNNTTIKTFEVEKDHCFDCPFNVEDDYINSDFCKLNPDNWHIPGKEVCLLPNHYEE